MHFNAKARINSIESDVFSIKQVLDDILTRLEKLESSPKKAKKASPKKDSKKESPKQEE